MHTLIHPAVLNSFQFKWRWRSQSKFIVRTPFRSLAPLPLSNSIIHPYEPYEIEEYWFCNETIWLEAFPIYKMQLSFLLNSATTKLQHVKSFQSPQCNMLVTIGKLNGKLLIYELYYKPWERKYTWCFYSCPFIWLIGNNVLWGL